MRYGVLRYQQVVIESGGTRHELSPKLHTLAIVTNTFGPGDIAYITIWNPSADTVSRLTTAGAVVEVSSGYLDDGPAPGIIVRGMVVSGSLTRDIAPPDPSVSFAVRPGDVRNGRLGAPKAWVSTTAATVWQYVVSAAGIDASGPPDTGAVYRGGFAALGDPDAILRRLAKDSGWALWVHAGRYGASTLEWDDRGDVLSFIDKRYVAEIGPDAGMIGSATMIDGKRVAVSSLLRPDIRPGVTCKVSSAGLPGGEAEIVVSSCTFNADSYDGPWQVDIEGSLL